MKTVTSARRGYTMLLVLVCLTLFAAMMGAIVRQGLMSKRFLERRETQLQAYWLAEAGLEHAAGLLLADPKDQKLAEEIVPGSLVRIEVRHLEFRPDTYAITSEAVFSENESDKATATVRRVAA